MISALLSIIFVLIIIGVLWWAAQTLLGLMPIAEPFRTVIYVLMVVVVVIVVLWIVSVLLGMAGLHVGGFRLPGLR